MSVNINSKNFTVYFKGDIVQLNWINGFAAELSPRFTFIYPLFCISLLPGMTFYELDHAFLQLKCVFCF